MNKDPNKTLRSFDSNIGSNDNWNPLFVEKSGFN